VCGKTAVADIVDASVMLLARRHNASVITSDPDDLARIDSGVPLVVC
jgi:hypothetical protein